MKKNKKRIFVAGHNGMVGSAIMRALSSDCDVEVLSANRTELDLLNKEAVNFFLNKEKPDQIYLSGAKVGGIKANNDHPVDFLYENLTIQNNIIHGAYEVGIKKLLFLGSSCIYPKLCPQPIKEEYLLTDRLEETNEPYAIAKIAGIKLCESFNRQYGTDFRSIMPTNLYGPNDNFDLENSHVIPALMYKIDSAVENNLTKVEIWGSGLPKREFLHVDDLAKASLFVMNLEKKELDHVTSLRCSHINIGSGMDISIKETAEILKKIIGYKGEFIYDVQIPDGPPRKLLDVSKISDLGWQSNIDLKTGLEQTYAWFLANKKDLRRV